MENKNTFLIFGGSWGALRRIHVNENFRAVRSHNRADQFITREKNNQTGPILLPSYPPTYINLHIQYGSNPKRIV